MTGERRLEPLHGYLRAGSSRDGNLIGRIRVGGVEYTVRAFRTAGEWELELSPRLAQGPEAPEEGFQRVL